jgi:hypothetical protein
MLHKGLDMNTLKGIIIVDVVGSPLWRAAMSHSLNSNIEVFPAAEYLTTRSLIRAIVIKKPNFLIFSWRGAMDTIFQSQYSRKKLLELDPWIFLLIPDYLGVSQYSSQEKFRIDMCDGIFVTSRQLMHEYQNLYGVREIQLLHDLPDLKIIDLIRNEDIKRVRGRVIWVGNSKWGERAGYRDHKGLRKFVLPAEKILPFRVQHAHMKIIDSAMGKSSYTDVLEEIARSECLILTSESEGTALPILEAAALGTPVVSFDVGIASELLTKGLRKQIVPKDLELLLSKVEETLQNFKELSSASQSRFEAYKLEVIDDLVRINIPPSKSGLWRTRKLRFKLIDFLKWVYRWLNN